MTSNQEVHPSNVYRFTPEEPESWKQQMLNWLAQFNICVFLNSHSFPEGNQIVPARFDFLAAVKLSPLLPQEAQWPSNNIPLFNFQHTPDEAVFKNEKDSNSTVSNHAIEGSKDSDTLNPLPASPNDFDLAKKFDAWKSTYAPNDWVVGHLSYEATSAFLQVPTRQNFPGELAFPIATFFVPDFLLYAEANQTEWVIESKLIAPEDILLAIQNSSPLPPSKWENQKNNGEKNEEYNPTSPQKNPLPLKLKSGWSKDEYIQQVEKIKQHIQRGDCYEMNFCIPFWCHPLTLEPIDLYKNLEQESPAPFSAFYRLGAHYLMCASPERFLRKIGGKLISQPIKGTAKRNTQDKELDEQERERLKRSKKERAENVMVVDLVRNDLSTICEAGSVVVEELFGLYRFPQVHQMISTISGQLQPDISFGEILKGCFPMGSMTGAPKKKVVELTAEYESHARGIYSGTVGYIEPNGDFDFNVIIRSLVYQSEQKTLLYQVGSGITHYAIPEQEYEECLLKAAGIQKALEKSILD